MKKLLLMASIVVITLSCSSSDNDSDNGSNNNSSKITPPAWIQGTWVKEDSNTNVGYRFTSDNFCQLTGVAENCWKEMANLPPYNGNIEQDITNNTYSIKFNVSGASIYYKFQKKSSNEIIWVSAPNFDESMIEYFTFVRL